jgi:RNA polymerase sigma-70 factor (ECF subfamily)
VDTRDLLGRASAGDEEAFAELVRRYWPRLAVVVRARMGAALRSRIEVDDLLQETFLHALLGLPRFEPEDDEAFLHWLCTIATNAIRKEAERWSTQKRDARREEPLAGGSPEEAERIRELKAAVTGPLTRALRNERDEVLVAALDELPEDAREAILLRYFQGLSWAEVARELGRPSEAAARELYRRARARLAVVLQRRGLATGEVLGPDAEDDGPDDDDADAAAATGG